MQTSLRKMGNSTGIILPKAILGQIGVTTGAAIDLQVEDGRLIMTPIHAGKRAGWAAAAAAIADEESTESSAWQGFANEEDAALTW